MYDELLAKTGYILALEAKGTVDDIARVENVRELKTGIIDYMKESGDNTLEGYLANVASIRIWTATTLMLTASYS